ncbi:bifunctional precorrin-2 dehydrogenase/sirohydrochlorin ferrochelatase [uncultured Ilyobacter sp.]|uniref:precorrin-2 dehydrogenase/sirohydrochlorin ferrochelatase family protein n=1 Tax=uncultured Ilyobacter sp. TaxID=544433 RepID=UPI0029F4B6F6|nr:bifunctional precorrin-2 dehydrogenase/sirohydrochlorin ferrochelatase [uncultured Ilyobacter sp.]
MEHNFFPLFIDLNEKRCLVIGAGNIACRKIKTLLKYGAKVEVITKYVAEDEILGLQDVKISTRDFIEEDLKNVFLVVAATSNSDFNKYIYEICNEKNILVNNMTSKVEMNARFAAIYESEMVQVAVSSKGYPKKSLEIRDSIKKLLEKNKHQHET